MFQSSPFQQESPYQQVDDGMSTCNHQMDSIKLPPVFYCVRCNGPFVDNENMACTGQDEYWHLDCLVCAQCFKPFGRNLEYYDYNGRKYCEQDFRTLFAPCCFKCNQYIIGRFIRALNKCWHPNCLLCHECSIPLADLGFTKSRDRALCYNCNLKEKTVQKDKYVCYKCKSFIEEDKDGKPLRYKGETFHAYHFNCHSCGVELLSNARNVNNDLYCLRCHDKREEISICGGCRQPIDGERIIAALGKNWHCEHFVCTTCERPFLGKKYFEFKGLAYCESDYKRIFGHVCHACEQTIQGQALIALGKFYCPNHFNCHYCHNQLLVNKSKFFDIGSNPCCKKCYKKFPGTLRRRLAKQQKLEKKKSQQEEEKIKTK